MSLSSENNLRTVALLIVLFCWPLHAGRFAPGDFAEWLRPLKPRQYERGPRHGDIDGYALWDEMVGSLATVPQFSELEAHLAEVADDPMLYSRAVSVYFFWTVYSFHWEWAREYSGVHHPIHARLRALLLRHFRHINTGDLARIIRHLKDEELEQNGDFTVAGLAGTELVIECLDNLPAPRRNDLLEGNGLALTQLVQHLKKNFIEREILEEPEPLIGRRTPYALTSRIKATIQKIRFAHLQDRVQLTEELFDTVRSWGLPITHLGLPRMADTYPVAPAEISGLVSDAMGSPQPSKWVATALKNLLKLTQHLDCPRHLLIIAIERNQAQETTFNQFRTNFPSD